MPKTGDEDGGEGKTQAVEDVEESKEGKDEEEDEGSDGGYSDDEDGGGDGADLAPGSLRASVRDINADAVELKADVRECKLSGRIREQVIELARQGIDQSSVQTGIAKFIKTQLDKEFNPSWHVVVGREFGMALSHADDNVMYFYLGTIAILVWKQPGDA